jgi:hypothetical protein|tara:strand:+ start:169 stop:510 length:342 start_codon:yes stop_codon:yes gene_type:complete
MSDNIINFAKAKERITSTQAQTVQQWNEDQIRTEIGEVANESASEMTRLIELNTSMLESSIYLETLNVYLGGLLVSLGHKNGDFSGWDSFWEGKNEKLVQLELDFNEETPWDE